MTLNLKPVWAVMALAAASVFAGFTARAVDGETPYATISARNAFGLLPLPAEPKELPPEVPLPKIVVKGFMNIFGRNDVLFTVMSAANVPVPCVLAEGGRLDDIEVVHINLDTRTVTFNNHGIRQEISFADRPASPVMRRSQ